MGRSRAGAGLRGERVMTTLGIRGDGSPVAARRAALVAAAGGVFAVAWVAGSAVQLSRPALDAAPGAVAQHYRASAGAAIVQALLLDGVAAFALIVVAWAVSQRATYWGQRTTGSVLRATGWAAAAVSLVQLALDLIQAGAANALSDDAAGQLFDAGNQLDGLKMLLLAVMVASGLALARLRLLPSW